MFKNGVAGYNPTHALTHPWVIVDYYYREAKYFIQRGYRGYSDRDNWSIDWYLTEVLPKMLLNLKKNTHGCPVGMAHKQWSQILQQMIDGFKAGRRIQEYRYPAKGGFVQYKKLIKQQNLALTLFKKHFFSLWD